MNNIYTITTEQIRFRALRNPTGDYIHIDTVIELLNVLLPNNDAEIAERDIKRLTDHALS